MDWNSLKSEYIAGGTSYRKLAEKYDVPIGTLRRVAKDGEWVKLREQAEIESDTKIIAAVSTKNAEKAKKVIDVANKLLDKLSDTIDRLDVIDSQSLKHYTSALKDLRDIKGVKSDADMREQEARIKNLEKQAMAEEESRDIVVTLQSDLEEYGQ